MTIKITTTAEMQIGSKEIRETMLDEKRTKNARKTHENARKTHEKCTKSHEKRTKNTRNRTNNDPVLTVFRVFYFFKDYF
jgi:hypothetical protein